MNKRAACALLLVIAPPAVMALVSAYRVEPVKADWSGWTGRTDTVSQIVISCWDSLAYVELFAGDYGQGGAYNLEVLTYPGERQVAYKNAGMYVQPHDWVRFDGLTLVRPESIIKGKFLEFRFTRAGTDSINYYYQNDEAYGYGDMKVGPGLDVAAGAA